MLIRIAKFEDYGEICRVVKKAFENAEHTDGNEHILVEALRNSTAFVEDLSLIAEVDSKIVAHIMFTKVQIGENTELALAPLSVLPEYQNRGIGTALINAGHERAKELGYHYSIVLGSAAYYSKTGYQSAEKLNIFPPFDVPSENFMVCRLCENAPIISGIVKYAKEFGAG